jgi:MoxR-like ATPase
MEERQVSVDGTTHQLPEPFVVVATQNPIEQAGTFRLPEAQRDRFTVKTSFGYPDVDGEMGLLERRANRRRLAPTVDPVVDADAVRSLQALAEDVTVETGLRRYIVDLARTTREDDRTEVGVSPRGVQRVFEAARARAVLDGRTYVTPDDVKTLAPPTMAHRLVLSTDATIEGVRPRSVVERALESVDVPAVSPAAGASSAPNDSAVGDPVVDRGGGEHEDGAPDGT